MRANATADMAAGAIHADAAGNQHRRHLLDSSFERFYSVIYRYLLHRLFDREAAEELSAETLYRAAAAVDRLPADPHRIEIWLLRTATNLVNSHYRKQRLRRFADDRRSVGASTHGPGSADRERVAALHRALRSLRPGDQTVVVLRHYAQMSFDDIAKVLGCRTDAARARLSQAIKRLRERLHSQDSHELQTGDHGG